MKKYILVILLIFCFGFTQAPHLKVLSRINAASGSNVTLDVDSTCNKYNTSSDWDTVHDNDAGNDTTLTGVKSFAAVFGIYRTAFSFNTGAELPDSITVTKATLKVYANASAGTAHTIIACDSTYDQTCIAGSYNDMTVDSPTEYGEIAITSISDSAYNDIELNSNAYTYIATQASTNSAIAIVLRGEGDADDTGAGYGWNEDYTAEFDLSTDVNKAQLYIEYTE